MRLLLEPTPLSGCLVARLPRTSDLRGSFTKLFHASAFAASGLADRFSEVFYSSSCRHVLRGLHFQTPPYDHAKLVACVLGRVWDVAMDLRRTSPTYGRHFSIELTGENASALYVPSGFAHGFLALEEPATMVYFASTEYAPDHDEGIRWDSADIPWPLTAPPIVSPRDAAFPMLREYDSPF
jgi:dTDP-4-dehydrorhamnose 3,5-epimerase